MAADLDFIKVVGRFGLTVGDGGDADEDPDITWCDSGSITFEPVNTYTKVAGASPIGWTGGQATIDAPLDASGYLTRSGMRRVSVVDLTSAKVNPQVPAGKATHVVRFVGVKAGATTVAFPQVSIRIAPDDPGYGVVATAEEATELGLPIGTPIYDLVKGMPVPTAGGTPIVVGPQGASITSLSVVGNSLVATLNDPASTQVSTALPSALTDSDAATASRINASGSATATALDARTAGQVNVLVPPIVTNVLASQSTVVAAASAAVAGAMNSQNLSWTLSSLAIPAPLNGMPTITTLRGTPAYGLPAKFGNALSGGALKVDTTAANIHTAIAGASITIEGWIRRAGNPGATAVAFGSNEIYVAVNTDGTVRGRLFSTTITSAGTVTDGNWHHIALCFDVSANRQTATNATLWVDGVNAGSAAGPATSGVLIYDALGVGGFISAGNDFGGSVDEFRLSNARRYTATFTPQAAPYTVDASTLILMHLSDANADPGGGYPPRPAGAAPGAVTYVGSTQPTDWLTGDIWRPVA